MARASIEASDLRGFTVFKITNAAEGGIRLPWARIDGATGVHQGVLIQFIPADTRINPRWGSPRDSWHCRWTTRAAELACHSVRP